MTVARTTTFILSVFIVGMVEMMVAGIMNLMSQDLHVSEAVVGQLVTLYALTFAICGPLLVKLTHRFSSRSVLLWTLIVFIFGNGMIAIAPHFGIIVVGRILSSAAASLIIVKVLALTAMLTSAKNRGKMIGIVYTGFSGANVFGVPIGTVIGDWVGWRFTFLFIIIVSVFVGVLMLIYLPKEDELSHPNQTPRSSSIESQTGSSVIRPREVFKYLMITSLALLVNGVAGVIGTSLGGVLSDKFTSKRWLIISISIFIIMMIILNLLLPGTGLLLVGLFMWNLMQWSTNPAIQSGIIEHVEGDTSQVMSWNMSSLNAGIGVGGIVGGLVMTHLSVEYVTYTSALIGLISLIIVFTLKNRHYAKNL